MNKLNPPKLPLRFFRWFCHPNYVEDIEGDLLERFEKRAEEKGLKKARWLFVWEVVCLLRLELVRPVESWKRMNHIGMLRHQLLISIRGFRRHKSSFLINLLGLSSGLASVLLIYLWVNDELNIDKFHKNDDSLYQVMMNDPDGETIKTSPYTPHRLARALVNEVPEVEYAAAVIPAKVCSEFLGDFKVSYRQQKKIKASGQFAENMFFNIFSYELIEGHEVLTESNSIVISERLAIKLFKTKENALGQLVNWQLANFEGSATVTGIFRNIPNQSTAQFDFVLDFDSWYELAKKMRMDPENWGNQAPYTYLSLYDGADKQGFIRKMKVFLEDKSKVSHMELLAVPYSSQYLYGNFENGKQTESRIKYVRLFSVIAVIILILACINFMNLATARASKRMREIGIKKAMGSNRTTLAFQFLGESILMAGLSAVLALILVMVFLPWFNQLTEKYLALNYDLDFIISLSGMLLLTGLIAGSYPAIYLSGFNPVAVLKGKLHTSLGELWMRKGLVIFQFIISIVLISTVLVVYKQIEYIQTKILGYKKDNVIWFPKEGKVAEKAETFLLELNRIPGVLKTSAMSGNLSGMLSATGDFSWEGKNPDLNIDFNQISASYDLIETLGLKILAGRSFSRDFNERQSLIFNEAAIATMGLTDPIGKTVKLWGNDRKIIGVVKDFHFESLHENVKPLFITLDPEDTYRVLTQIEPGKEMETIALIDKFYSKFNPGYSFNFQFLDNDYQALYVSEKRVSTLSALFAGLAILISCLGLLGLVAFTAEKRTKEIGIRKILGLNEMGVIRLVSRDFMKLVIVAAFIALPVSYFLTHEWLNQFAYRIKLEWWFFACAGIVTLFIAWIVASWQTFRIAHTNPSECLRDE